MEHHPDYADGLRDGEIKSLQNIVGQHQDRLNDHSERLRILERIIWALAGVIAFVQVWPAFEAFMK